MYELFKIHFVLLSPEITIKHQMKNQMPPLELSLITTICLKRNAFHVGYL